MSIGLVIIFGIAISGCLGMASFFYIQFIAARNSAQLMSRVIPIGGSADDLTAHKLPARRIAQNARLAELLRDAPMVAGTAELLDQAGSKATVAEQFGAVAGTGLGVCLLVRALGFHWPAAVFVGFVSGILPIFYRYYQRGQRLAAFEKQLPQALELLTLYLRSGRSLPQAFVATTEELMPPASEEFAVCAEAYRLGRPLPQALRLLSNKYQDSLGLKLFSIAVSVLGQTGGNLVEVIERIRKSMEASLMYVLKLRGLTGETRNSAVILGAVPGVFMAASAIIMPEYFNQFFLTTLGYILFGLFCFVWVAGLVWVRVLMNSKA